MDRDVISCEVTNPTADQLRFAASVALGADERYHAVYYAGQQRVELLALSGMLPRNLFVGRARYELTKQCPVTSASVRVEKGQWWDAMLAALADLQASDDWADHGCASPLGRYEITTPHGSTRVENEAVALTVHDALRHVGARPRLRDHGAHDPRDGIDRVEGKRVIVEVDGCRVPMSAQDLGQGQ